MHLLITAGPTREPIDAVRFISNRSSGKLGLALTRAAVEAGHAVTLLLGPIDAFTDQTALPENVRLERFETTGQLQTLLDSHFPSCDALIMAAAVADYRPKQVHEGKLPRGEQGQTQMVELEPTPDLIAGLSRKKQPHQRTIAFALEEPGRLNERMHDKLKRKGVDAIVGNALATMGSDEIAMRFHPADGKTEDSGPLQKAEAARWLLAHVAAMVSGDAR